MIEAEVIIDELAPTGDYQVQIALLRIPEWVLEYVPYSNSLPFQVMENPDVQTTGWGYGVYDDFDGHGCEQSDGSQLAEAGVFNDSLWSLEGPQATVLHQGSATSIAGTA